MTIASSCFLVKKQSSGYIRAEDRKGCWTGTQVERFLIFWVVGVQWVFIFISSGFVIYFSLGNLVFVYRVDRGRWVGLFAPRPIFKLEPPFLFVKGTGLEPAAQPAPFF